MGKTTCQQCEHYSEAKPYRFGVCSAPVPAAYFDPERNQGHVGPDDTQSEDCECFAALQGEKGE